MADEKTISQEDIEKLLSQGPGGAAPAAKATTSPTAETATAFQAAGDRWRLRARRSSKSRSRFRRHGGKIGLANAAPRGRPG